MAIFQFSISTSISNDFGPALGKFEGFAVLMH